MTLKKFLKNIRWSDKVVDLFVVILGISIAFAMDNCSNVRKTAKTRNAYFKTLLIDLRKDSVNLSKAREGIEMEKNLIDTLFAITDKRNENLSKAIASKFSIVGAVRGNFTAEKVAYESLKESGSISIMGDSVNIKLNRLHDEYQQLERDEEFFKTIIFEYAVPIFFNYDSRVDSITDPSLYFSPKFNNVLLALSGNIGQRKRTIEEAGRHFSDVKIYISKSIEQ